MECQDLVQFPTDPLSKRGTWRGEERTETSKSRGPPSHCDRRLTTSHKLVSSFSGPFLARGLSPLPPRSRGSSLCAILGLFLMCRLRSFSEIRDVSRSRFVEYRSHLSSDPLTERDTCSQFGLGKSLQVDVHTPYLPSRVCNRV